jgi:hypothetical protein
MASGAPGCEWGKKWGDGKEVKRIWSWRFIALIETLKRKGRQGSAGRRGGNYGGRAVEQRKGGRDRKEKLTGGAGVSVAERKRRGREIWAAAGKRRKGSGPVGPKGEG